MHGIPEEALQARPKKPLNAYFLFRAAKVEELKDNPNKNQLIKQSWEQLDVETRAGMEANYRQDLEKYKIDHDEWMRAYSLTNEQLNNRSRPPRPIYHP
jgi:hypothetical protein